MSPRSARKAHRSAIDPANGAKTVIASNLDIGLAPYPGGPPALVPTGVACGQVRQTSMSAPIFATGMYKTHPSLRPVTTFTLPCGGGEERDKNARAFPFIKDFKFDYGTAMEVDAG